MTNKAQDGALHGIRFGIRSGIRHCSSALVAQLVVLQLVALPCLADESPAAQTGEQSYPALYFSQFQPLTALDMVTRLPGFTIREGDSDLRGYAGAAGNVLIDGQRPTSKEESLTDILKRIPAENVEKIQLIRDGKARFDMQGHVLLANVIRKRDSKVTGQLKVESTVHEIGGYAPRVSVEASFNGTRQSLDLAGSLYREIDDQKGRGTRNRFDPEQNPLRLSTYSEPEIKDVKEFSARYKRALMGGRLRLNGFIRDDREEKDISQDIIFPAPESTATLEQDKSRILELDLNFERPLGPGQKIEILGLHRNTNADGREQSTEDGSTDISTEEAQATETILRGVFRQDFGALTVEGGLEAAWNRLDSTATLEEGGLVIDLPAASVRVSEDRLEAFASAVFQLAPDISLDTGLRYETSALDQSGDSDTRRRFSFLKPRALLRWQPFADHELRLYTEREVGQLDFEDFISSTSLAEETITAGNKELRPENLWRFGLESEHQFGKASLVFSYRHEQVRDVIDHIPLTAAGELFDAVGNIPRGTRNALEINLNLPGDQIGLRNLTLQANTVFERSRVTDPLTGEKRRISGSAPFEGDVQLSYDIPAAGVRLGAEYEFAEIEYSYELNEVQRDKDGDRLTLFVEYKPAARWALRAFARNLTNSPATTRRQLYTDARGSSPLEHLDIRRLEGGRSFGISVEWLFP